MNVEQLVQAIASLDASDALQCKLTLQEWKSLAPYLSVRFLKIGDPLMHEGESDRELLETVQRAHRELGLWRAYFSAFHPIERSPLEGQPAEDPTRALRLYQSDFMIRDYGFRFEELPFDESELLPRDKTPKVA